MRSPYPRCNRLHGEGFQWELLFFVRPLAQAQEKV